MTKRQTMDYKYSLPSSLFKIFALFAAFTASISYTI